MPAELRRVTPSLECGLPLRVGYARLRVLWALLLFAGGSWACGRPASDARLSGADIAPPETMEERVVAAALASIDSTSLPWPFVHSFMVNTTVRGWVDTFGSGPSVQESPLDLLGIQERGFGLCSACDDADRQAHAWVTLDEPVAEARDEWVIPYAFSVREWGSRSGMVRVRCEGGACRAVEGGLDSLAVPTPECCPVFVRVKRPRR